MSDFALTDDGSGNVMAHRADCPDVQVAAMRGEVVMTMFGCEKPLPDVVKQHECLLNLNAPRSFTS